MTTALLKPFQNKLEVEDHRMILVTLYKNLTSLFVLSMFGH